MKKSSFIVMATMMLLALASCKNTKDVVYFQNIDDISLANSKGLYTARIMPKDELTITVNASDPQAASVFNLSLSGSNGANGGATTAQNMLTYLVDNDGNINYPQLGKIHVVGKSREELQDYIAKKIQPYFAADDKPIVTVKMSNYRVTVLGEVSSPKVVNVTSEKMSVIEALASAGDLGIYGQRTNVLIIREAATGEKTSHRIDLTDANVVSDPYYYVQQNDIIYVTPNKIKAKNSDIGTSNTYWWTFVSIGISLFTFVASVLK